MNFINPPFAELGWDVENRQGHPEAFREVAYEDRVKVGGGTKALRGGYGRFSTKYIEQLPIRTLDFSDPEDVERHEWMVGWWSGCWRCTSGWRGRESSGSGRS